MVDVIVNEINSNTNNKSSTQLIMQGVMMGIIVFSSVLNRWIDARYYNNKQHDGMYRDCEESDDDSEFSILNIEDVRKNKDNTIEINDVA